MNHSIHYICCRPGASEAELDAAEEQASAALPPEVRVLYRLHDGQDLAFDRDMDARMHVPLNVQASTFLGLLGG